MIVVALAVTTLVFSTASGALAEAAPRRPVIVSLTFDDGLKSELRAARIMEQHEVRGTFYVNSGVLYYPAFLTVPQLLALQAKGHEIAGHTWDHRHLSQLSQQAATREVCGDRATLLKVGIRATDFAYPFGEPTQAIDSIPAACGYNSARGVSGLYVSATNCSDCSDAELLPSRGGAFPIDENGEGHRYYVRASQSVDTTMDLTDIERQVLTAQKVGGWLPIVFHGVCTVQSACTEYEVLESTFAAFMTWLVAQPNVRIETMHQVVGGPLRPAVGPPLAHANGIPLNPPPLTGSLSARPAWTIGGFDIGQAQVIATFVLAVVLLAAAYRLSTRGRRYHPLVLGQAPDQGFSVTGRTLAADEVQPQRPASSGSRS